MKSKKSNRNLSKSEAPICVKLTQKDVLIHKKVVSTFSNKLIFTELAAEQSWVGSPWPRERLSLVRSGVWVAAREGGPIRANINLLQQSIFHHTHSLGTSQSGLYPFCQWLSSSINFIENYIPDRWCSRPLSICPWTAEVPRGGAVCGNMFLEVGRMDR